MHMCTVQTSADLIAVLKTQSIYVMCMNQHYTLIVFTK